MAHTLLVAACGAAQGLSWSPLNLTSTRFSASGSTVRANSSWGSGSTGAAHPPDERLLTFWGRWVHAECQQQLWNYTAVRKLMTPHGTVDVAYSPTCGHAYGPSVEADILVAGIPTHLVRTVASSDGPFGTYGQAGQGSSHANKHIGAAYVAFNPRWQAANPNRMKPFSAAISKPDRLRTVIRIVQSVTTASIPQPSLQQLQQTLRVAFINELCDIYTSRSFCQMSLNLKTMLAGVNAYGPDADAKVLDDPGQRGLIVVLGPVNTRGRSTSISGDEGRRTAWTSWGASTTNGSFATRTFQVEVSWDNFLDLLRVTTNGKPAPVFGASWNERTAWVLKNAGYGQENYNAGSTTSTIEGLFQSLEVSSVG